MAPRYWTLLVFGVCFLVAVVYDSIMAAVSNRNTLSWITAQWALKHTISVLVVGLVIGIILGHLFWYQNPTGSP